MRAAGALYTAFAVLFLAPALASACTCQLGLSVCNEVAAGTFVFSGTVESVTPHLLDHWNTSRRASMNQLNAANVPALKSQLQKLLPDLPSDRQKELAAATTQAALVQFFGSVLDQGRMVTFRVKSVYARGTDDDDNKDADNDDSAPKEVTVWTPFGDCGVDFQTGETYLVYSTNDEETGMIATTRCTRTKRLTDAGEDLPYLEDYRDTPKAATRLEGFATYNPTYHTREFPPQEADVPDPPVPGLTIELTTQDGNRRFTTSDQQGRFLFDGLAEGDYQVKAWAPGFPDVETQLAASPEFHVEDKECGRPILIIPRPSL
jgi:hypothetical protein